MLEICRSTIRVGKVDRDGHESRLARSWLLLKLGNEYMRFFMLLCLFFIYC